VLITNREDRTLISGFAQVLQFNPVVTFTDGNNLVRTEWWRTGGEARLQEIQGHARYSRVRTYRP
jgi:hypothetical protein